MFPISYDFECEKRQLLSKVSRAEEERAISTVSLAHYRRAAD